MSRAHGLKEPAGIDFVPHSRFHHGRFGRLFRNLDPASHSAEALEALAGSMVDSNEPPPQPGGWGGQQPDPNQGDNPGIPAGYTYFGQFVDHDITFDPASSLQRWNDPSALHNFRTPRFDLDSVYGEGPDDEPFLYDEGTDRAKMLLGRSVPEKGEFDLPRNGQGVALIGDPRNDENVIVSQLQVAFLRAHNKLAETVGFEEARRQLRWHYQYVVVNDFLRKIVPTEVISSIQPEGDLLEAPALRFFGEQPYMPVEFSVAAYRFGHSMIRPRYDVNDVILDKPIFDGAGTPGGGQDLRGVPATARRLGGQVV
jgi:Animal haem peroxidase